MKQISFSQVEYAGKKRTTRREVFLAEMEQVMPWSEVLGVIEPHYPKGMRGRPPVGLERMLRVYLVQQWYNLSDEGAEDEITDSQALRGFVGIDLSRESAPDATTLLQFRHLLEKHELTKKGGIMEQPPQPLGSRPGADHFFPASAFYEPSHGYTGTHDIPP
jgi:IS5 family transposase